MLFLLICALSHIPTVTHIQTYTIRYYKPYPPRIASKDILETKKDVGRERRTQNLLNYEEKERNKL